MQFIWIYLRIKINFNCFNVLIIMHMFLHLTMRCVWKGFIHSQMSNPGPRTKENKIFPVSTTLLAKKYPTHPFLRLTTFEQLCWFVRVSLRLKSVCASSDHPHRKTPHLSYGPPLFNGGKGYTAHHFLRKICVIVRQHHIFTWDTLQI